MDRFNMMLSLDYVGKWRVIDTHTVYADSRPMDCEEAIVTMNWLNEANLDNRLRTVESEFGMGDWVAE